MTDLIDDTIKVEYSIYSAFPFSCLEVDNHPSSALVSYAIYYFHPHPTLPFINLGRLANNSLINSFSNQHAVTLRV